MSVQFAPKVLLSSFSGSQYTTVVSICFLQVSAGFAPPGCYRTLRNLNVVPENQPPLYLPCSVRTSTPYILLRVPWHFADHDQTASVSGSLEPHTTHERLETCAPSLRLAYGENALTMYSALQTRTVRLQKHRSEEYECHMRMTRSPSRYLLFILWDP